MIPLLARAEETRKGGGIIDGPEVVESVDTREYDFDKWRDFRGLVEASVRTRMFDDLVQSFLDEHPDGTVIEIGAGLNTRYERLDNGRARWLETDLPDSMTLRRLFFEDAERRTMMATSTLDADWLDALADERPACFLFSSTVVFGGAAASNGANAVDESIGRCVRQRLVVVRRLLAAVREGQPRPAAMRWRRGADISLV